MGSRSSFNRSERPAACGMHPKKTVLRVAFFPGRTSSATGDLTPGTEANEFREEHERRVAEANRRFTGREPGCLTDRGHVYILYGTQGRIDNNAGQNWH